MENTSVMLIIEFGCKKEFKVEESTGISKIWEMEDMVWRPLTEKLENS